MKIIRSYFNKLYNEISEPQISILVGARQVGKSTLLRDIEAKAHLEGHRSIFYDLEQSAELEQLSGTPKEVFQKIASGPKLVFIDEFHYLPNAFKLFKAIYDSRLGIKIYASGSSSIEIHKHIKESLTGRFKKTVIYPVSYSEYKMVPYFAIEDYLQWGGMPGLLSEPTGETKMELLENIVSTYLTKDIKGIIREENIRSFNSLLYILAQTQQHLCVTSNMAREVGLAETTVKRYLDIMTQTYTAHAVPSYSGNMANELKKSKKYYLYDLGIRNHLLKDYRRFKEREDQGALLESFVFLNLLCQQKPNMEIRFWRTKKGQEVDFIVVKNRVPLPVEVKSSLTDTTVPPGLAAFLRAYPKAPYGIVYNLTIQNETICEGRKVLFKKVEEATFLDYMQTLF